jgi:hypothetical protein
MKLNLHGEPSAFEIRYRAKPTNGNLSHKDSLKVFGYHFLEHVLCFIGGSVRDRKCSSIFSWHCMVVVVVVGGALHFRTPTDFIHVLAKMIQFKEIGKERLKAFSYFLLNLTVVKERESIACNLSPLPDT